MYWLCLMLLKYYFIVCIFTQNCNIFQVELQFRPGLKWMTSRRSGIKYHQGVLPYKKSHADGKEFLLIQERKPDWNGVPFYCAVFWWIGFERRKAHSKTFCSMLIVQIWSWDKWFKFIRYGEKLSFFLSGQFLGRQQFNFSQC